MVVFYYSGPVHRTDKVMNIQILYNLSNMEILLILGDKDRKQGNLMEAQCHVAT